MVKKFQKHVLQHINIFGFAENMFYLCIALIKKRIRGLEALVKLPMQRITCQP